MIARTGKRVMLVDCDPQCNLTGLILGYSKISDAAKIVGKRRGSTTPHNIRDGLSPAFESRPTPIVAVECVKVPGNDNLVLLPGHIGLAEYEVTLGIAQSPSGDFTRDYRVF
jgi:cellulose biosynthesis protein BcsQ